MFSDFSDIEDGEILFSEPEDEQRESAQEPAGNDVSVAVKISAKTEAEILDLKIKQAEESYRDLYNKYAEKVKSKHAVAEAFSHNHPGYYTAKAVESKANPANKILSEKKEERDTVADKHGDSYVDLNLTVEDKERSSSPDLGPASTEPTSLGLPKGRPILLVKFFDLDEEEVHLAETLCGFDQEQGDILGDLQRNGVRVGIYVKIVHCQPRGEVYKLRDMLNGIKGTFCGSTITLEIKY